MIVDTAAERPLPEENEENRPYWDAARAGQLVVQRCLDCGALRRENLPPVATCHRCWSLRAEWVEVSGKATLYTFTVIHQAHHPYFQQRLPYVLAYVELDEGPLAVTYVTGVPREDLRIGMPLEVMFEDTGTGMVLPCFRATSPHDQREP